MSAVRFKNPADVRKLYTTFKSRFDLDRTKWIQDSILDIKGHTYSVYEIKQLSNEEASKLSLEFPTRTATGLTGHTLTALEVKHASDTENLIHNKPLIETLLTVNMKEGKLLFTGELNLKCPISKHQLLFPVITANQNDSTEFSEFYQYIAFKGESAFHHNDSNFKITHDDLFFNYSLRDLLWVSFVERQSVNLLLKNKKIGSQKKPNIYSLTKTATINQLTEEKNDYLKLLTAQIDTYTKIINQQKQNQEERAECENSLKNFLNSATHLNDNDKSILHSLLEPESIQNKARNQVTLEMNNISARYADNINAKTIIKKKISNSETIALGVCFALCLVLYFLERTDFMKKNNANGVIHPLAPVAVASIFSVITETYNDFYNIPLIYGLTSEKTELDKCLAGFRPITHIDIFSLLLKECEKRKHQIETDDYNPIPTTLNGNNQSVKPPNLPQSTNRGILA